LLLSLNAMLALLTFITGLADEMAAAGPATASMPDVPQWVLGLANAGLILVVYGALGSLGLIMSYKLGLAGVYRKAADRRELFLSPLLIGVLVGIFFVLVDQIFAGSPSWDGFSHPVFPASLIASASAGIGEEIVFRMFVLSLWAFLLNLLLKRWNKTGVALWTANIIAALAFAAGHIPSAMFLLGARTLSEIPPLVLTELFLLNATLGLIAGERYVRVGLVAAIGVHFWTDIVWHVLYPLIIP
jgi:membrane protease YdiL (CAAX protease family)